MEMIDYIILIVIIFILLIAHIRLNMFLNESDYECIEQKQLEINIYPFNNCQFITDKQEYWCIEKIVDK